MWIIFNIQIVIVWLILLFGYNRELEQTFINAPFKSWIFISICALEATIFGSILIAAIFLSLGLVVIIALAEASRDYRHLIQLVSVTLRERDNTVIYYNDIPIQDCQPRGLDFSPVTEQAI